MAWELYGESCVETDQNDGAGYSKMTTAVSSERPSHYVDSLRFESGDSYTAMRSDVTLNSCGKFRRTCASIS